MDLVKSNLDNILSNKYVFTFLSLFLVLYGGLAKPAMPKVVVKLFDNKIFRIIYMAMIVYMSKQDIKFAIMMAVAFSITMELVNQTKFLEGMANHGEVHNDEHHDEEHHDDESESDDSVEIEEVVDEEIVAEEHEDLPWHEEFLNAIIKFFTDLSDSLKNKK